MCERERELDGRCVCVREFMDFTPSRKLSLPKITSALCYNPVKKRVMVTPTSAEKEREREREKEST